jgi:hypothetical protein
LIDNVLGPNGLLSGKTRVLATNSIPVLVEADFVALLRDGRIIERGTYEQLLAMKGEVFNLIRTAHNQDQSEPESSRSSVTDVSSTITQNIPTPEEEEEEPVGMTRLAPLRNAGPSARKESVGTLRRASSASIRGPRSKIRDEEEAAAKSKQSKEFLEQGKVKWDVYLEYAKTSNLYAVLVYLTTLVAAQTAQVGKSHLPLVASRPRRRLRLTYRRG